LNFAGKVFLPVPFYAGIRPPKHLFAVRLAKRCPVGKKRSLGMFSSSIEAVGF
jgi:hypothetical protein